MAFGGMMLTSAGRSLLAAAQLGAPLEFVHIALGDGHYSGSYNDITKLSRELLTAPIKQAVKSGEQVSVDFCIENAELSTGYYLREIGLFARSGDQLILYAYDNAGQDADYIPAGGGAVSVERVMRLLLKISGVSNVVIDGGGSVLYATQQDFLAHTSDTSVHVTPDEKRVWDGKQPAGNYATKATTLAGYGITDGATKSELSVGLAGKQPVGDYATKTELNSKAPIASPALTGTPTAPTAAVGSNNTQLATTAFVQAVKNTIDGLTTLTHSKSGTVHALTGLSGKTGIVSVKFKATAAFAAGDSFKVDGVSYTAKQANGKALAANQFVSGAVVDCLLDTEGKTVNFKGGDSGYPEEWNKEVIVQANESILQYSAVVGQQTFMQISNVISPPESRAQRIKFGDNDAYLFIGLDSSPYLLVYKKSGNTFNIVQNAITSFYNMSDFDVGLNNNYLAIAHSTLSVYKRNGDSFSKLSSPTDIPSGSILGCSFSSDGNYLAVTCSQSPYLAIYKRNGDVFTKLPLPSETPSGSAKKCEFSTDGIYLAVVCDYSPYIVVYKRSGDVFTKLANPTVLPGAYPWCCAWSYDNTYLAVGSQNNPVFTIYKRNGDTLVKLPNPEVFPKTRVDYCTFSKNGKYMAVSPGGSGILIYTNKNDLFYSTHFLENIPETTLNSGCSFSSDGMYLAASYYNSPFFSMYDANSIYLLKNASKTSNYPLCFSTNGEVGFSLQNAQKGQLCEAVLFPKFNE